VYAEYDRLYPAPPTPRIPEAMRDALSRGVADHLGAVLDNDLMDPALELRPDLQRTHDDGGRAGAIMALLSGSGPTMLFLCEDADEARQVAGRLVDAGHPDVRIAAGPVAGAHVVSYA
jgi:4-diphosphocytidyl-2-C-methyl-D-erythritol kinase